MKTQSAGCPFQEAKLAIAKAEEDFSKMLDKGLIDCTKAMEKLKSKHQKLTASRKKVSERKKALMERIKQKPTVAQKQQLEKIRDALKASNQSIQILSEEMLGVKHGLTKIKTLQKQRSMEAKILAKFRKEQEKKHKKSKK